VLKPLRCPLVAAEDGMKIEQIDKRFGAVAVEKGFITIDQLMDALEVLG